MRLHLTDKRTDRYGVVRLGRILYFNKQYNTATSVHVRRDNSGLIDFTHRDRTNTPPDHRIYHTLTGCRHAAMP